MPVQGNMQDFFPVVAQIQVSKLNLGIDWSVLDVCPHLSQLLWLEAWADAPPSSWGWSPHHQNFTSGSGNGQRPQTKRVLQPK